MMRTAIITLSKLGLRVAKRINCSIPETDVFVHESVDIDNGIQAKRFSRVIELTAEIFNHYQGIVYIAPCGVVVRAVAPLIAHKTIDPAVVVVDVGARYAISLLSGHEGGANGLSVRIANIICAEPVVTTTTEAAKNIILGIGCRKNMGSENIKNAIMSALCENNIHIKQVRLLASADIKSGEPGLLQAAHELELPVHFIPSVMIRAYARAFDTSEFVMEKVNLPAVAEPAALLAGRRTSLIQKKKKYGGITVAVAMENFL
jgi:cobalt-precorrin 5A hydrolase